MGHLAWSQDDFNPNAAAIFTPLHSSILPGSLESLYGDFLYQQQQGRYVLTGMHGLCNIAASSGGLDYRFVTFNSQGDLLNVDSAIIPGQRLTLDIGPIRDLDTGTRYQRNTHTNAYEALNVDPGLIGIVGDLYVPSPNTSILIFGGLFCIRRHRKT